MFLNPFEGIIWPSPFSINHPATSFQSRQRYIDKTIEQGHHLGLTFPDPNLKFNEETKIHDYSPIDWDEFWNVVKGNGPGNKLRINHHIKAHEDGKWVREAAKAYSKKINLSKKTA